MVEQDFKDLAEAGVKLLGEVGLGSVKAGNEAAPMVKWARKYGIQSTIHTGGPSIPGSGLIDKDVVLEADADIIGHINGGHTALPEAHVCELCETLAAARSRSCTTATRRVAIAAAQDGAAAEVPAPRDPRHRRAGRLGRAAAGHPAHDRACCRASANIPAELVFCFATGNTARIRKLNCGLIEVGRAADFVFMDRAQHTRRPHAARKRAARRHPGRRHGDDRRHRALRAQPQHAAGDRDPGRRARRALSVARSDIAHPRQPDRRPA